MAAAYLFPQAADMHGQGVVIHEPAVRIPQRFQQRCPGDNGTAGNELGEDLIFRYRQQQDFSIPAGLQSGRVQRDAAAADFRLISPQLRPDAAQKLLHPKRLGHIVVAPGIQTPDHIQFFILCREKHHRCLHPFTAPCLAQVHAVPIRQTHIQQHQIDFLPQGVAGREDIGRFDNGIPFPQQQLFQGFPQGGIVFHKEYFHR